MGFRQSAIYDAMKYAVLDSDRLNDVRQGTQVLAYCPFHTDSARALFIDPGDNSFECFVCQAAGGVQAFLQRVGQRP